MGRPRSRAPIAIAACIAVLPACGLSTRQQAAVQTFSAATIDFTRVSSTELVKCRTDVLEMNGLRRELEDGALPAGPMDRFFTVERVKTRLDALAALERYATLLHTLVTSSQEAELRRAADAFLTSVRKVDGVTLSDAKAAAITAAVERVGGLLVEYMRARAVREVVTESGGAVLEVVALVRRDFSPDQDHLSLGYELVAEALHSAADLAARRNGGRSAALIGAARVVSQRNRDRLAAVSTQVTGGADGIAKAEANLRQAVAVRDADTADIERFAAQVQELTTIYMILRDR
jgi:hypothetical protein